MNSKWPIAVLIIIVVVAVYLLFDGTQQQNPATPATSPGASTVTKPAPPVDHDGAEVAAKAGESSMASAHTPVGYDYESALREVETIFSAAELSSEDEAKLAELQEQFTVNASINPVLRAQLIELIKADPGHRLAKFARAILAQLAVPEVVDLGLEMAQSTDRDSLLAGLDLLSEIKPENEQTLAVAEQALESHSGDADVLLAAVQAIPVMETNESTNERIINSLSKLVTNEDDAVRSASIFAIARRAQDSTALSVVVQALDSEEPDDRISAAMALKESRISSDDLGGQLVLRMADQSELWEVRRIAADSLSRFTLTDEQKAQLAKFRQEQTRVSLER